LEGFKTDLKDISAKFVKVEATAAAATQLHNASLERLGFEIKGLSSKIMDMEATANTPQTNLDFVTKAEYNANFEDITKNVADIEITVTEIQESIQAASRKQHVALGAPRPMGRPPAPSPARSVSSVSSNSNGLSSRPRTALTQDQRQSSMQSDDSKKRKLNGDLGASVSKLNGHGSPRKKRKAKDGDSSVDEVNLISD